MCCRSRFFDTAFDHKQAERDGRITPKEGADEQFEAAKAAENECLKDLNRYLAEMKKELNIRDVSASTSCYVMLCTCRHDLL